MTLNWAVNGSNKCKLGTLTAGGTVSTNGVGGTVQYHWVENDGTGARVINEPSINVAAGDTSAHALAQDNWIPQASGTEQLVVTAPSVKAPATQTITLSYVCR
jgi:hypothetical protein